MNSERSVFILRRRNDDDGDDNDDDDDDDADADDDVVGDQSSSRARGAEDEEGPRAVDRATRDFRGESTQASPGGTQ